MAGDEPLDTLPGLDAEAALHAPAAVTGAGEPGRKRRFRLTLRLLMMAVAVVAVLLEARIEAARLFRKRQEYQQRASEYASAEQASLGLVSELDLLATKHLRSAQQTRSGRTADWEPAFWDRLAQWELDQSRQARQEAARHGHLRRVFERAAARPWETPPH